MNFCPYLVLYPVVEIISKIDFKLGPLSTPRARISSSNFCRISSIGICGYSLYELASSSLLKHRPLQTKLSLRSLVSKTSIKSSSTSWYQVLLPERKCLSEGKSLHKTKCLYWMYNWNLYIRVNACIEYKTEAHSGIVHRSTRNRRESGVYRVVSKSISLIQCIVTFQILKLERKFQMFWFFG